MKSLLLSLFLVASTQVFAAQVELGKYRAVDQDTKQIVATFELKANGTVDFQVKSPDFVVACSGQYAVNGNEFATNLKCKSDILQETSVKIDISSVNSQSIRSANGAAVKVIIEALGDEAVTYLLKKAD